MTLLAHSSALFRFPRKLSHSLNSSHLDFGFVSLGRLFHRNMSASASKKVTIGLDPFCYKQFDKKGVNYIPYPKEEFLEKVFGRSIAQVRESLENGAALRDGYAPFCKHLFLKNFTEATCGAIDITRENEHLLRLVPDSLRRSGYLARTPSELPVLSRWFRREDVLRYITRAEFLDVILYSREQLAREYSATKAPRESELVHDYYVISIKPQNVDHELPMLPITIMRNALIEEGGSGVPIDRDKYAKSVEYWSKRAVFLQD